MARTIEGVFFDLGDTLIEFRHVDVLRMFRAGARSTYDYLQSVNAGTPSFERYHFSRMLAIRWNYLKSLITGREFNSLRMLEAFNRRRRPPLSHEQLLELAWLWYQPLSEAATVDADAKALLSRLRDAGLQLGLISNTFVPGEVLDRHLKREGLLEYLPIRVYSCHVGHRKPDRRTFAAALDRSGLAAERTLYVGDSPKADIIGAGRMGMVSVLKDPLDARRDMRGRPDHRIHRLSELIGIIESYNGPLPERSLSAT